MIDKSFMTSSNFCGVKDQISKLICRLRSIMYPRIFGAYFDEIPPQNIRIEESKQIFEKVLIRLGTEPADTEDIIATFLEKLPTVYETLETDVTAAYDGDPAAKSREEIMLSYPGFEAISIHRMAHELYRMDVPILPRMMSEIAHSMTGIDIHPGAKIGPYFFIDHGTGVVIGETATLGHHVKLYQGVTIGAKSFQVNEDGSLVKGNKRHPDIGNHVVIYAGATILGGDTMIGDYCIIGGNVWLTRSVQPHRTIIAPQAVEELDKKI
ncbi:MULTISPECIES: serine O-acetyltransferase EpsC [unclassified Jeotgalibaca]|uniref:serine O-acetyltransferase EpsC n=1 Tax=unclassified Jeotgalibaca TaxID=2621505 RepID=UPI003FD53E32